MSEIAQTSRAERDLVEIWAHVAIHNTQLADRLIDLIQERCQLLLRFPRGGEACPRFGSEMRWFPAGNYVIFYRPDANGIQVIRVLDGRRDLDVEFWK
jgi:toxin ParE1/3/4